MVSERAQVYTLEGIIAALIVLAGVFFALQATTATPQAASTSSPHAEQLDRSVTQSMLVDMEGEQLRESILYWNEDDGSFHCTPDETYYINSLNGSCPSPSSTVPANALGDRLEQYLGPGYSYNVIVSYTTSTGTREDQQVVFQGEPGNGAIRAGTTVTILDSQQLLKADGTATTASSQEVGQVAQPATTGNFFATDGHSGSEVFNVFRIEVIVWRG